MDEFISALEERWKKLSDRVANHPESRCDYGRLNELELILKALINYHNKEEWSWIEDHFI